MRCYPCALQSAGIARDQKINPPAKRRMAPRTKALLDRLLIADWGIPEAVISDRDPKFMSDLWQISFIRLDTRSLVATAYHPQTNGASERMNQTVEIATR